MNLLHMKYAVEIAEAKSINRASETLFVGMRGAGAFGASAGLEDVDAAGAAVLMRRFACKTLPLCA